AGSERPLRRAQMLPRPGADDAVSNAMPSCAKIRAKNCIVRFSFPGGLVVLIWRYSRTRWTASSFSLASFGDCWARRRGIPNPGAMVMTTNATVRRRMASFRGGEDVEMHPTDATDLPPSSPREPTCRARGSAFIRVEATPLGARLSSQRGRRAEERARAPGSRARAQIGRAHV